MQSKVTLYNNSQTWNPKRRVRINDTVNYLGYTYQNSTGINSDPLLLVDWVIVKKTSDEVIIYDADFVDSGTHEFTVPTGIYIQNAFLNGAQVSPFTQTGTTVTVTNSVTDDLVKLTGRN